jgi:hypothetical protein
MQVLPTSPRTTGSSFFSPGRGGASPDGRNNSPGTGGNWWQGGGPLRNTGTRGLGRLGRGSTQTPPATGTPGGMPGLGGRAPSINPGTPAPRGSGAPTPGTNAPGTRGGLGSITSGAGGSTGPRWGSLAPSNPLTSGAAVPGRGIGSTPSASTGHPSWQLTPPRGSTTYTPPAAFSPTRGGIPWRSFTPAPAAVAPRRTGNVFAPTPSRVRLASWCRTMRAQTSLLLRCCDAAFNGVEA